ncbi:hypothetical protein [Nocardioides astragali]|uniref:Uncharacterized protein n=1 Tax=Nocardioides astragali TaxID=1776736 RepID=A0ABW2N8X0_9ACTN|nr:hypothetical protein [Nocardioides astragali]
MGPYFALSSVISGTEGISARYWYEEGPLRRAFVRRFLYPGIAGFVLGWTHLSKVDVIAVGPLAAGLLLWPMVFVGLPWYVPRHSWHLPTLYASFVVAYGASCGIGLAVQRLVVDFADGNVAGWLAEQLVFTLIFSVVAAVSVAVFRAAFASTTAVTRNREAAGSEVPDEFDDR